MLDGDSMSDRRKAISNHFKNKKGPIDSISESLKGFFGGGTEPIEDLEEEEKKKKSKVVDKSKASRFKAGFKKGY